MKPARLMLMRGAVTLALCGFAVSVQAQVEYPGTAPEGFRIDEPQITDEVPPVMVMEHEVIPKIGMFVINSDVNVRSGPGTDFKRVSGLKAGERVRAIGKVEGSSWMAVSKDGVTLGFVYTPVLVPVVDGSLSEQFFGSYMSDDKGGGIACDYRFRFEGKTAVEGGDFETADYEARFRCASQLGAKTFYAHMFLTEAPEDGNTGLHLIGLDTRSIGDGMEEFLSTRFLYNPTTGEMTFEGHSLPRFAKPPKPQTFKTTSIKDALTQALEASVASWTDEAWNKLLEKPH